MEVSDEQKSQIRAEEVFREAVRAELKSDSTHDSFRAKIVTWLNKPLGIWFLSAVLVAGISETHRLYQSRQAEVKAEIESRKEAERARLELIRKLDGEIAMRLNRVRDSVLAFAKGKLESPDIDVAGTHYPEFRDRTVTSLMYELQSVLDGPENQSVRDALGQWFILQHWEAHKGFAEKQGGTFDALKFFMTLLSKVFIARWGEDINKIIHGSADFQTNE